MCVGDGIGVMVVADLHVHTTNSDGALTLDVLPAAAERAGVETVAVTDHDRTHPDLEAPVTEFDGLEVIHGIELRVESDHGRVDLLGLGVEDTTTLSEMTDRLQANRIERAREIVSCVEDRLGVELDVAFEPGVGRPHIARAIEESPSPHGYYDAFDELIGNDGPCYVAREIPPFAEGLAALSDACGLVSLAHPFRYDDPGVLELAGELDAIEGPYPYEEDVDTDQRERLERVVETHDLLVTGGSDAHDETLGKAGLDREAFEPVRRRIA